MKSARDRSGARKPKKSTPPKLGLLHKASMGLRWQLIVVYELAKGLGLSDYAGQLLQMAQLIQDRSNSIEDGLKARLTSRSKAR